MRPSAVLTVCVAVSLPFSSAIFADEAYQTDYHHALLGLPQEHTTFFHRPQAASRASLLYTLSTKAILGAVNPKDGSLVWRQQLASTSRPASSFLRAGEGEGVVISAISQEVRAWDALKGKLLWSNEFQGGDAVDLEVVETVEGEAGQKDAIVLFSHNGEGTIRRLSGETGDVVWQFHDNSGDVASQVSSSASGVYLISLHASGKGAYKLRITILDLVTGMQTGQYTLNTEADITDAASILFVGANAASPIIAWTDKHRKMLKFNIIGSKVVSSHPINNPSGDEIKKVVIHAPHLIKSVPHFLAHFKTDQHHWAEVFHISLAAGTIASAYSLPRATGRGAFSTSTQDANVYFTHNTEDEVSLFSSASPNALERWPVTSKGAVREQEEAIFAVSEIVPKGAGAYAVRSAVLSHHGNWKLVRNGILGWVRLEGLAGVVAAQWAELSEEETLARELEEEGVEDPLSAYLSRTRRHLRDLEHLPSWLQALPQRILSGIIGQESVEADQERLHRDSFGFRKLVILATERGHLYALDTGRKGAVVWTVSARKDLLPTENWDVLGMFVDNLQRTTTVKGADGDSITVNTFTGAVIATEPTSSGPTIEGIAVSETSSHGRAILDVRSSGQLDSIPESQAPSNKAIIVVHSRSENTVRGIRFGPDTSSKGSLSPKPMWSFSPPRGFVMVDLTTRPAHDPVASIGRVLGDRSVMYKYLNPSLLLITATNTDTSTLILYLLDSISGAVLHTLTHNHVDTTQPISATMSEHWFAYTFFSTTESVGNKLFIAELYESGIPNDRGPLLAARNVSSIRSSGVMPHVVTQSYILTSPLTHLTTTTTMQGITARSLLAYLPYSHALVSVPRQLLDPRRPVDRDPDSQELEEGLMRYTPVLEIDPQSIISHQREVLGVKAIITSPAVLESTSLVLAWGDVDIFGTRVAPSMAFDVLGKGFGRGQLILTVLGLGVGVVVIGPLVRQKQVNARWQT